MVASRTGSTSAAAPGVVATREEADGSAAASKPGGAVPTLADVFAEQGDYVWNTFRRLGVSGADVKDLTQDFFVTLHRLLPSYDRSRPIRPWLFTIAYRMAIRHLQRARRETPTEEVVEVADSSADLERQLDASRDRELVLRALTHVPIERRAVFVMADIDEVAVPEIADRLQIPLNTAYSRLRLARNDFRAAIGRLTNGVRP